MSNETTDEYGAGYGEGHPPETNRKQWVVRDELGNVSCAIYAATRDEAIDIFCHPALRREAYFSPRNGDIGGWSCEEHHG